jgi:hypothetical protein
MATTQPPRPDPIPCPGDRCTALIPFVWFKAGAYSFWAREAHLCPACTEKADTAAARAAQLAAIEAAGIPPRYRGYAFDRFLAAKWGETRADFEGRLRLCAEPTIGITAWNRGVASEVRNWSPSSGSLLITGPVGGGKTTLLCAGLEGAIRAGKAGLYLREATLLQVERARATAPRGHAPPDLLAAAQRASVLGLDDLGTVEEPRAWQRDLIEGLICERWDRDLPLIATTNRTMAELAGLFGERVASRLTGMCGRRVLLLQGWDWRTGEEHAGAPVQAAEASRDGRSAAAGPDGGA